MSWRDPHDLGQSGGVGVIQSARRILGLLPEFPQFLGILFPLPFRQPVQAVRGHGCCRPGPECRDHHATTTHHRDDQVRTGPRSGIHMLGGIEPTVEDGAHDGRLDRLQTSAARRREGAGGGEASFEGSGGLCALARRRRGRHAGRVGGGAGHREHPGVALDPAAHDQPVFTGDRRLTGRASRRRRSPSRNGPEGPRLDRAVTQALRFSGHAFPVRTR